MRPPCRREHLLRAVPCLAGTPVDTVRHPLGRQQLLLGRDHCGAVEGEERLPAAHRLSSGAHEELLDEAVDLGRNVYQVGLGDLDAAHGAHGAGQIHPMDGRVNHSQRTFLLRREVHGLPDRGAGAVGRPLRAAGEMRCVFLCRHLRHGRVVVSTTAGGE
jgi:hypothetical protein